MDDCRTKHKSSFFATSLNHQRKWTRTDTNAACVPHVNWTGFYWISFLLDFLFFISCLKFYRTTVTQPQGKQAESEEWSLTKFRHTTLSLTACLPDNCWLLSDVSRCRNFVGDCDKQAFINSQIVYSVSCLLCLPFNALLPRPSCFYSFITFSPYLSVHCGVSYSPKGSFCQGVKSNGSCAEFECLFGWRATSACPHFVPKKKCWQKATRIMLIVLFYFWVSGV